MEPACIDCKHFQKTYFGWYVICNQCDEYSRFEDAHKVEKETECITDTGL